MALSQGAHSVALSSNQRLSVAISSNQRLSVALTCRRLCHSSATLASTPVGGGAVMSTCMLGERHVGIHTYAKVILHRNRY